MVHNRSSLEKNDFLFFFVLYFFFLFSGEYAAPILTRLRHMRKPKIMNNRIGYNYDTPNTPFVTGNMTNNSTQNSTATEDTTGSTSSLNTMQTRISMGTADSANMRQQFMIPLIVFMKFYIVKAAAFMFFMMYLMMTTLS